MAKTYEITEEISNEIRMIRKAIKNKSEDIKTVCSRIKRLRKKE